MSRSLIESNTIIFSALDRFCEARGEPLRNAGTPRWIASVPDDRRFMMHAAVVDKTSFSPTKLIARGELDQTFYLFIVGFDTTDIPAGFEEADVTASHITVILSEGNVRPRLSPLEIRDLVEVGDKHSEPSYVGHEVESIRRIFPPVRVFKTKEALSSPWKTYFRVCLYECSFLQAWIDEETIATLHAVCDLDADLIPYKVLCRSIFDSDPGSLFLALYRCLERLYAFSSARELSLELNSNHSWDVVASALEDKLGWWPKEEGSLEKLLHMASSNDLESIFKAMNEVAPAMPDRVRVAARRVYKLRNSLVHYRPSHSATSHDRYEWNKICTAMAGIVLDVHQSVFSYKAPGGI